MMEGMAFIKERLTCPEKDKESLSNVSQALVH